VGSELSKPLEDRAATAAARRPSGASAGSRRDRGLLVRAITAFIALPGLTGFVIPALIGLTTRQFAHRLFPALALMAAGTCVLVWSVREFYVTGRGTLAPWARPTRLVTTGPYRLTRNPMYLCVALVLAGWCTLWDSTGLRIYAMVTLCILFTRVLWLEEKWVAREFGAQWDAYRERTPRWLL
jgi:protein-S-isoprenylcysteine O-methyltransferase Ste14